MAGRQAVQQLLHHGLCQRLREGGLHWLCLLPSRLSVAYLLFWLGLCLLLQLLLLLPPRGPRQQRLQVEVGQLQHQQRGVALGHHVKQPQHVGVP